MMGNIQRRVSKSWRIKYEVGRDPATDARLTRYLTVRGTKRDAQRELTRILREIDTGSYVEPTKMTTGEHLENWLGVVKPGLGGKTYERYAEIVRNHLIPALGALPLVKLSAPRIEQYYADAREIGRRDGKGGLSERTMLHHHRVLRKAIRKAVGVSIVRDPMEHVEAPKPDKAEIEVLDEAELAKLLKAARGTRMYAPALLAATTGLRRGEVLALRWRDVDLDGARLTVNQALEETKAGGVQFKSPKSKSSRRTVTLPALTVDALRRHKQQQAEERMKLGLGKDPDGLVFTNPLGEMIRPRNFTKEFGRIVKRTDVRQITFHGLRHTHFTDLMRKGVNPKIVQERAGHATVSITLDIYSHVQPGMQEAVANEVDESLGALLKG